MTLPPNTRLGPYEILAPLGAGGMGEVYRARDMRLGRDVAVKVLPATYSADKERLQRFEQEACAAGALNHPNILSIYDIGSHDGSPYVVSELLEGETLRQRTTGAALAQRRIIDYALQIAHGLAAAHDKGIVHRDLKPENLFVTKDGRIKILDFGLAKLTGAAGSGQSQTDIPTRRVDTDPGKVMGTVGYMSPEQVRGRPADHRSDLFSLGAILYEMLSGKRGESAVETMNAILKEDPPELSQTNQNIAPAVERVVDHCLEKNPEERFQSARDLAFALEAMSGSTSVSTQTAIAPALAPQWIRRNALTGWIVAGVAILLAIIILALAYFRKAPTTEIQATRFYIFPPEKTNFQGAAEFISPDGRRLIFSAVGPTGTRSLWIRSLDSLAAQPLPGTDDGIQAFWSPDGRFVGFFAAGKLKKIEVTGGPAQTLASVASLVLKSTNPSSPYCWSADGRFILYGQLDPKTNVDIWTLPLFGDQKPIPFLQTGFIEAQGRFSSDGRWVAYASNESGAFQVYVQSFPKSGGKWMISTNGGSQPRWRRDGKELFYLGPDRKLMVVDAKEDANKFEAGSPRALFDMRVSIGFGAVSSYEVTRDGQRFLINTPVEESAPSPLTVVLNWTAGLKP